MRAAERVSVADAIAWIDAAVRRLESEEIALDAAAGRVLASDLRPALPIPPVDCAAVDGYAVRAEASLGAGAYNPITLAAVPVEAGDPLPLGTDAVVPSQRAEPDGTDRIAILEPTAPGAGIDRKGAMAAAGALLLAAGARLASPRHIGLLASITAAPIGVVRRPRVRLVIAATPRAGLADANRPMLTALIERDGGVAEEMPFPAAIETGADLVLVAGGTGEGREDRSAALLAAAGSLEIRGVALAPGETAGFGHTANGTPALLLPGSPAACLVNYELFAGRAIRRLGGLGADLPYSRRIATIARKIVSAIGTTEIRPIRLLADGRIEPAASFAETGLRAAVESDGFVILAEASEGHPAGAQIIAYFYDEDRIRAEPAS